MAEHCIVHSRSRIGFTEFSAEQRQSLPPVPQALVRTIPQSGRKTLYLASHAGRVYGMTDEAGRRLIDELIEHATQRQFVYTHRWRERPRADHCCHWPHAGVGAPTVMFWPITGCLRDKRAE